MTSTAPEGCSRLSAVLARSRSAFLWASALGFCINLLLLTVPVYMMQVFDRVIVAKSLSSLAWLTVIAAAALALYGVFEVLRSRLLVRVSLWFEQAVAPAALGRALDGRLGGQPYRTEALRDLTGLRQFLGGAGALAILDAPWVPLFLVLIFLLHPLLGLISLLGAAVLFLLAWLTEKMSHGDLREANTASMRALRIADMAARNAEVIDAMGMNGPVANRWALENARMIELQGRASDRAGLIHASSKALRLILQLALLGAGGWLVVRNELSAGAMIAASIIMARALAPVELAIGTWRQACGALDAYRRLRAFLDAPPARAAALPLPRPRSVVSVENVSYQPPGAVEPVVRNVGFRLGPGEAIGVIGPSAAGKSSLARMLIGTVRPTRGAVRLDGADIFMWNRDDIGRHVGYLPQDIELFEGSVRDNIARLADVAPEAIVAAAQLAGAHDMILRLPNGYETQIGEPGGRLSGGQRQRIALARALLGKPALVVLDEPNSNLDAEGESALNEAIAQLKEAGAAVVVIGHRPSIMAHVDKLLVLHAGRMELLGPRRAVLEKLMQGRIAPVRAPARRALAAEGAS